MEELFVSIFQLNYWENRYQKGGTSGEGSVEEGREWKWRIIDSYVSNLQSVVDVGCGDLRFWLGRKCRDYDGIDISNSVLERNKSSHPEWRFIHASSDKFIKGLKKKHAFCIDLLFHIMDEDSFVKTLHNVCRYSSKYVFIHTWKCNPFSRRHAFKRFLKNPSYPTLKYVIFPSNTDMKYQYFRLLTDYNDIFQKYGFQLLGEHENPNKEGCMYVFEKKVNR
jgi:ubiquinone/menaquinone biosynthesis C-methylase UbiE